MTFASRWTVTSWDTFRDMAIAAESRGDGVTAAIAWERAYERALQDGEPDDLCIGLYHQWRAAESRVPTFGTERS